MKVVVEVIVGEKLVIGKFVQKGYAMVKVKNKDGKEGEMPVGGDSLVWYYMSAKPLGITHWWNE